MNLSFEIEKYESDTPLESKGKRKDFFRFYLLKLEIVVVCFSLFFFFFLSLVEGELVSFSTKFGSSSSMSVKKERRIVKVSKFLRAMVNNFQIEG